MNNQRIAALVEKYKLPKFRTKQFREAFFEKHYTSFNEMTNLPKKLRDELVINEAVLCLKESVVFKSSDG